MTQDWVAQMTYDMDTSGTIFSLPILYSSRRLQKRSQTPLELKISSFVEFIAFASGKTKPLFTDSGEKNMLTVNGGGEGGGVNLF